VKQKVVCFAIVESMAVHTIFIGNAVFDQRFFIKIFQVALVDTQFGPTLIPRMNQAVKKEFVDRFFSNFVGNGFKFGPFPRIVLHENLNFEVFPYVIG
jgi:hypothetical protein